MFLEIAGGVFVGVLLALILFEIIKRWPQVIALAFIVGVVSVSVYLVLQYPQALLWFLVFDACVAVIVALVKGKG